IIHDSRYVTSTKCSQFLQASTWTAHFLCRRSGRGPARSGGDQSLVDARVRSFQSAPCFCQFIRMWRLLLVFLPSATDWPSDTQRNRTIAAGPTTRICGSLYSSNRNFDLPLVALAMKVALSSTRASEWL